MIQLNFAENFDDASKNHHKVLAYFDQRPLITNP